MLVEINNLKEGILICKKDANGKLVIEIVPFEELIKSTIHKIDNMGNVLLNTTAKVDKINEKNLPKIVDDYIAKHKRIINFMAFEVMLDDINYNGVDYPPNFKEIQEWIFKQTSEVPKNFQKYINKVKGDIEDND